MGVKKKIALIIPAYNESECVDELAKRLAVVFDAELAYDFEALIVENGSTDDTMEKLLAIHAADPRFKILQLARNFWVDGGLTAGLDVVDADAVVLMTADLQDPPEFIPELIRKWEEGYENIYRVVTERSDTGPIRTMNSRLFYWLADKLTDDRITKNVSDFRLVDRKVYEAVRSMDERNRFVRGLFSWVGFKSIGLPMVRAPRFAGESKAYSVERHRPRIQGHLCALLPAAAAYHNHRLSLRVSSRPSPYSCSPCASSSMGCPSTGSARSSASCWSGSGYSRCSSA